MNLDIDIIIFLGFLAANLVLGLLSSRKINTIKAYAVGDGNFSTITIASTIVATWVSGEFFVTIVAESYDAGLIFMFVVFGDFLSYLLVGLVFAPRMAEFLGKISIADAMGGLYGQNVQTVTAISGFMAVSGIIAIQLQIAGVLFEYALGIPIAYGILALGIIITLYSSLGGIKSVAFTDVMQFCAFGIIIPAIAYFLLSNVESGQIINTLTTNPLFDYTAVFTFNNPQIYCYISLFLWLLIPSFNPAFFQRVAMAKDVRQARNSFIIASISGLFIAAIVCWIGVLILTIYPNIAAGDILKIIISDYGWITGFKGLILAGIMAMVMSTIDSYINSSSILLVHDIWKSLNIKFIKNELFATRICSGLIGSIAIILAMRGGNFFELILWTSMLYMPIVSVPFLMTIFGFRSSSKSVLIGMSAGAIITLIWELFFKVKMGNVGGLIPGMLTNLIFLTGSHYLLKQKGGWVGIKDQASFVACRTQKKIQLKALWKNITSFDFLSACKENTPKNEVLTSLIGVFIIVSTFFSINTIPKELQIQYAFLINVFYPLTLFSATVLIGYPLWSERWKETNFMAVCWNIIIFFVLICFSFLIVLISNFSEIQLMVFMVNILMISSLINWRWSLFYLVFGLCITLFFYERYLMSYQIQSGVSSLEFKIIYLLLLISSILIMFLKPKQEYIEATEQEAKHLKHEVKGLEREVGHARGELENVVQGLDFLENQFKDKEGKLKSKEIYLKDQLKLRNIEISKLKDLKDEFIRNIPHEANTPMTGILSLSEVLYSCYDSLDEKIVKQSIKDIVSSSDRLKSFVSNIADLSKLSALTYELNKTEVDLSVLVRERPMLYKKIFADDDRQEFIFKVEDKLMVQCDEYYITQAIDNLISNSVKYGEGKPITISLTKTVDNKVQFSISDQGIGIPQDELISIFHKFTTSSKTQTPAGGRGVGLALCEKVISVHGGNVEAKSDGKKGSSFSFVLPL